MRDPQWCIPRGSSGEAGRKESKSSSLIFSPPESDREMAVSDFAKKERKSHFFISERTDFFFSPSKQKLKQSNDACTFSRVLQMKEEEREREEGESSTLIEFLPRRLFPPLFLSWGRTAKPSQAKSLRGTNERGTRLFWDVFPPPDEGDSPTISP